MILKKSKNCIILSCLVGLVLLFIVLATVAVNANRSVVKAESISILDLVDSPFEGYDFTYGGTDYTLTDDQKDLLIKVPDEGALFMLEWTEDSIFNSQFSTTGSEYPLLIIYPENPVPDTNDYVSGHMYYNGQDIYDFYNGQYPSFCSYDESTTRHLQVVSDKVNRRLFFWLEPVEAYDYSSYGKLNSYVMPGAAFDSCSLKIIKKLEGEVIDGSKCYYNTNKLFNINVPNVQNLSDIPSNYLCSFYHWKYIENELYYDNNNNNLYAYLGQDCAKYLTGDFRSLDGGTIDSIGNFLLPINYSFSTNGINLQFYLPKNMLCISDEVMNESEYETTVVTVSDGALVTFKVDNNNYAVQRQTNIIYPVSSPTKDGYIFVGWDKEVDTIIYEPITVNAVFVKIPEIEIDSNSDNNNSNPNLENETVTEEVKKSIDSVFEKIGLGGLSLMAEVIVIIIIVTIFKRR